MIVYSILVLGFPLSEIEVRTNMMGNIGLDRYPYHEQQRKPYHCFPGQHKQREWEFFDKPSYYRESSSGKQTQPLPCSIKNTQILGGQ